MKKIRKGYKNWLVIDIAHYLKKKNIKTKSMAKINVRTSLRKTQNKKRKIHERIQKNILAKKNIH